MLLKRVMIGVSDITNGNPWSTGISEPVVHMHRNTCSLDSWTTSCSKPSVVCESFVIHPNNMFLLFVVYFGNIRFDLMIF